MHSFSVAVITSSYFDVEWVMKLVKGQGKGFPQPCCRCGSWGWRPTVSWAQYMKGGAQSIKNVKASR